MLSLSTHVEVHLTPAAANETFQRLLADETPPIGLQLLRGRPTHDHHDQPIGGFAGPIAPDAPAGTFADRTVPRHRSAGDWASARNGRRQGSFGDTEHDELVTIDRAGNTSDLRAFWNTILGPETSLTAAKNLARTLGRAPAADAAVLDEAMWAKSSFELAQNEVYTPPIGTGSGPFAVTPAYRARAKSVARAQIALAGARLANVLNAELR